MSHALSPLPVMNIASSFLLRAACKFAVGSSLCRNPRIYFGILFVANSRQNAETIFFVLTFGLVGFTGF